MKNKAKALCLLFLAAGLGTACSGGGNTSSGQASDVPSTSDIPTYKIKSATIAVNADSTYQFAIKLDQSVEESVKWYLSSNSRYDSTDTPLTVNGNGTDYSFVYDGNAFDFYLLMVGGAANDVYAKQNFILPTVNLAINEKNGKDVLSFSYLNNGYGPEMFFEEEGLSIFRSVSSTFDSTAVEVEQNVSIADEFIIDAETGQDYYFFVNSMNGGKIVYTSQAFKKGVAFGSDLITVSSVTLTGEADPTLKIEGSATASSKMLRIALYASSDTTFGVKNLSLSEGRFSYETSVASLVSPATVYNAYVLFGAGIFYAIPSAIEGADYDAKIISGTNIYSLVDDKGTLGVSFTAKGMVNVFSAKFVSDESGKVFFETKGLYDDSLFPVDDAGTKMLISNPILEIDNDQNNTVDVNDFALSIDSEKKSFEAKADLTSLDKIGPWYNVKLWFNSDTSQDSSGASVRKYAATYEYLTSDANMADKMTDTPRLRQYLFQEYSGFLKIQVNDLSTSITSWDYVNINGKVNLRLSGTYLGNGSYFTVYSGTNTDPHNADVVPDSTTHAYVTDINIDNIVAGTNYHVHWLMPNGGNEEVTNKYMAKPNAVLSSKDGYIFCVKQESWSTNLYYKVYKDQDIAKANGVSFAKESNAPTFTISGAVNSTVSSKNLFVRFGISKLNDDGTSGFDETSAIYAKVSVDDDLKFTATADLSSMAKGSNYEARLIEKLDDGSYKEIPSGNNDYCGFYNEYLLADFASASLSTASGTYHVATYTGENSLWTLYLYLA